MAIALLRTGLNPFDLRTLLFAKHAQHVVLIHFPIALFIGAVAFRPYSALDEARWPGGRSLLQPATGSDFDTPGSRHGDPRVAVPARGAETEGHPTAAPDTCVRLERDDLAGLVGKFPRAPAGRSFAKLPSRDRISSRRCRGADSALGRLPKRRKRVWLDGRLSRNGEEA
jgi:hypothetical protein